MSDSSFLDHLPSAEREKIRKRLRSPEEYERLREKVKGPEDLEREMDRNAEFAEAKLILETEPKAQEKAKNSVQEAVKEEGMESAFEKFSEHLSKALEQGKFDIVVDQKSHELQLAVKLRNSPKDKNSFDMPSGNVQEVFPLKISLQQQLMSSFSFKNHPLY